MGRYKKYLAIFLMFSIHMMPFNAWAGAAEKWDYEVKPDTNQKLKVTGHKVDQFGDAVNDKKYTTTIDPKTTANRQKMGGVGIAKLLKKANWATVGVEAFQALLEGIDWVMDLEQQSIWRYKTPNDQYACTMFDGKVYVWKSVYTGDSLFSCPIDAVNALLKPYAEQHNATKAEFDRWHSEPTPGGATARIKVYLPSGSISTQFVSLTPVLEKPSVAEKEYLTPEQAADYANHTHPDYTNPKYAERANPLYKPEIQENLWKPHNKWEEENSPTVQEVKRELEKANPDSKDDTIKENPPNPETGEKTFSLPAFCSWATAVCEFFEYKDQGDTEIEVPDQTETVDTDIAFATGCPVFPIQANWHGFTLDFTIDLTNMCDAFSTIVKPIVISMATFSSIYILAGVRNDE